MIGRMSGWGPHRNGVIPLSIGLLLACTFLLGLTADFPKATPRFAMREKVSCSACHVNPSGGGARNDYGAGTYSRHNIARETSQNRIDPVRRDDRIRSEGRQRISASRLSMSRDRIRPTRFRITALATTFPMPTSTPSSSRRAIYTFISGTIPKMTRSKHMPF